MLTELSCSVLDPCWSHAKDYGSNPAKRNGKYRAQILVNTHVTTLNSFTACSMRSHEVVPPTYRALWHSPFYATHPMPFWCFRHANFYCCLRDSVLVVIAPNASSVLFNAYASSMARWNDQSLATSASLWALHVSSQRFPYPHFILFYHTISPFYCEIIPYHSCQSYHTIPRLLRCRLMWLLPGRWGWCFWLASPGSAEW